jgi:hypothetical protein
MVNGIFDSRCGCVGGEVVDSVVGVMVCIR